MGRSPMMGSGYGGQEELAPVAGLCDGFHQPRAALAERVPGGRESHSQISDQRTIAVVRWREGDLGRDCQVSGAESPTGSRLHRQTGYDPGLVSEARRSEIRRLEETRLAGRARVDATIEELVVKLARENSSWGYDRIVGAVANLGHKISDQSVGNILRRHGIAPSPKRKQSTTWSDFIGSHMNVLAGADFFTVAMLTWRGLETYYVLFFIHLGNRRVSIAGITDHPDAMAMEQMARNATMEKLGCLHPCRYLLHDRDTKFCESFREVLKTGEVKPLKAPARSPNLNAYAERSVRSVKEECLSRLILFGESSLRRALTAFVEHYHGERNHQGKENVLLFPAAEQRVGSGDGKVRCKERLGGLLKYYHREVA